MSRRKPLAGAAWFEAQGRRAASQGLPILYGRTARHRWPLWARKAWALGWMQQRSRRTLGVHL